MALWVGHMSFEQPGLIYGNYVADIDMSNNAVWRFAPVWLGPAQNTAGLSVGVGNPALVAQGALTTPALGILQAPTAQGMPGCVVATGVSKCLVSTAITTVDQPIQLVAGGCIPATSGNQIDGYAKEIGPVGAYIAVELIKNGKA